MISLSAPNDHPWAVPGHRLVAIVAGALLIPGTALPQPPATSTEPMVVSSASSSIEDATDTADFKAISVSQGARRVTADRARATGLDFQNSQWTFVGRVVFSLEPSSLLWADRAILEYHDGKLAQVTASGSPTHFEHRRSDARPPQRGQADVITYDPKLETVQLQGHARLSDGDGTEINAPMVVYSIRDHKGHADSGLANAGDPPKNAKQSAR